MASQVDPVQAPHRIVDSPIHRSVSLEEEEEEQTLASGLLVDETQGRITPFELQGLTEVASLQNNLDQSKPAAAIRSVTMEPMNPDIGDVGAGALLKSKEPLEVENNSETLYANHPPEFPEDEYIFDEQTWANLMAETESPTQDQLYKTSTEPLPAGTNMDFLGAPDACNDGNIPYAAPQSEKHSEEDTTSDSDRRKKRPNTQTGPQRPLSAYNLFFRDFRRKLIDQHGGPLPFSTLGKEVGKTWKSLSKKERKHWEDQSEVDSQRYQQEVKELRAEIRAKRRRASFLHVAEHSSTETGMAERSIDNKAGLTCTSGENKPRVHLCHQPADVAPAHQGPAPLYAREMFDSSAIEAGSRKLTSRLASLGNDYTLARSRNRYRQATRDAVEGLLREGLASLPIYGVHARYTNRSIPPCSWCARSILLRESSMLFPSSPIFSSASNVLCSKHCLRGATSDGESFTCPSRSASCPFAAAASLCYFSSSSLAFAVPPSPADTAA